MELVSLEPRGGGEGGTRLHEWRVLGKTVIGGAKLRTLANELDRLLAEAGVPLATPAGAE